MQMLSDDDRNLSEMTPEQLDAAWDLWFDLAQATNDHDPAYEHGVFAGAGTLPRRVTGARSSRRQQPAPVDDQ